MKIAYLIAAHTDPKQLRRLVWSLDTGENEFYVHIDKKQDISLFKSCLKENTYIHYINKMIFWNIYLIHCLFRLIMKNGMFIGDLIGGL